MSKELEVPKMDVDDFLAHYGVAGMKWGRRKGGNDKSAKSSGPSRSELRTMDKAARQKIRNQADAKRERDGAANDNKILKARNQVETDRTAYRDAYQQYKVEKKQIGRVAAKQTLKKYEDRLMKTHSTATQLTREEAKRKMYQDAGAAAASALIKSMMS